MLKNIPTSTKQKWEPLTNKAKLFQVGQGVVKSNRKGHVLQGIRVHGTTCPVAGGGAHSHGYRWTEWRLCAEIFGVVMVVMADFVLRGTSSTAVHGERIEVKIYLFRSKIAIGWLLVVYVLTCFMV